MRMQIARAFDLRMTREINLRRIIECQDPTLLSTSTQGLCRVRGKDFLAGHFFV